MTQSRMGAFTEEFINTQRCVRLQPIKSSYFPCFFFMQTINCSKFFSLFVLKATLLVRHQEVKGGELSLATPSCRRWKVKVFLTTMPSCSPPTCLGEPCWQLHRWQMGLALGCSYRAAVVPQSLPVPSKAGERHILDEQDRASHYRHQHQRQHQRQQSGHNCCQYSASHLTCL